MKVLKYSLPVKSQFDLYHHPIIDEGVSWSPRLDNLNKNNRGLTGPAGFGLEFKYNIIT